MIVTLLITTAFFYQNHHPVDGRIIGRNMLIKILQTETIHQIKVHLLFVDTFYKSNMKHTKMFYNSSNRGQCPVKLTERTNNR